MKSGGLWFRRFLALILVGLNILAWYVNSLENGFSSFLKSLYYLTTWGRYLSLFTLIAGSLVNNQDIDMIEDLNYIDPEFMKKKYTPFRAWKWYCFLFQFTFVTEIVITVYFWTLLNKPSLYRDDSIA